MLFSASLIASLLFLSLVRRDKNLIRLLLLYDSFLPFSPQGQKRAIDSPRRFSSRSREIKTTKRQRSREEFSSSIYFLIFPLSPSAELCVTLDVDAIFLWAFFLALFFYPDFLPMVLFHGSHCCFHFRVFTIFVYERNAEQAIARIRTPEMTFGPRVFPRPCMHIRIFSEIHRTALPSGFLGATSPHYALASGIGLLVNSESRRISFALRHSYFRLIVRE